MIEIVKQTIDFFVKNGKKPEIKDLEIKDKSLLEKKWALFVTLYLKWEVRGSAWNIKELKENQAEELIENTIFAISKDKRFSKISASEAKDLKIRVDFIVKRNLLKNKKISELEPIKSWVVVIKNNYSKLAAILPNINPKIINWTDFIPVLKEKLSEKSFNEDDYIIYEIKTETKTSY